MNDTTQIGEYNGVDIVVHNESGEVHLSGMAKAAGKRWNNYWQNETTQAFIAALARSTGIPVDRLVRGVTTGPNDLRGTWGHRKVAYNFAQWCSPEFAVAVVDFLDSHFANRAGNFEHFEAKMLEYVDQNGRRIVEYILAFFDQRIPDDPESAIRRIVKEELAKADYATKKDLLTECDILRLAIQRLKVRRLDIHPDDVDLFIRVVKERLGGFCPCCQIERIIGDDGEFIGQREHFQGPDLAGRKDTWVTCRSCNQRLWADSDYRRSRIPNFITFQALVDVLAKDSPSNRKTRTTVHDKPPSLNGKAKPMKDHPFLF